MFYAKFNNISELEKNYSLHGHTSDGDNLLYINKKNDSISCKLVGETLPYDAEFELYDEYDKELTDLFE